MKIHWILISIFGLFAVATHAKLKLDERPAYTRNSDAMIYHGKIVRPNGKAISGDITLLVEIYSPEPSECLLWSERQTIEAFNGGFSAEIGYQANRLLGPEGGSAASFREVFINNPGLTISNSTCAIGTSYSPGATDDRLMKVTFVDDGTEVTTEKIPIKSVPFAKQAQEIGGYNINNLFKISGAGASSVVFEPEEVESLKTFSGSPLASQAPLAAGTSNQVLGMNAAGDTMEYKSITAGSNVTITHSSGGIQISAGGGGGGSVTNVSGTGPISVSDGTTNPTISISQASSGTSGYLSAADWALFNSKQPAGSYLTGISGAMVNTALGFTPQPAGAYLTSITGAQVNSALGYTPQSQGNYLTGITGDVVATGPGSVTATIQANAVTTSKIMALYDAEETFPNIKQKGLVKLVRLQLSSSVR